MNDPAAHDAQSNPYHPPSAAPEPAPLPSTTGSAGEEVIQTIVPTRNVAALVGYYLGLFSIFPVLGLPLAVAGIVLGWKGLKKVRQDPAAHGTAHAYVGLGCGLVGLALNTLIVGALIVGLYGAATGKF